MWGDYANNLYPSTMFPNELASILDGTLHHNYDATKRSADPTRRRTQCFAGYFPEGFKSGELCRVVT